MIGGKVSVLGHGTGCHMHPTEIKSLFASFSSEKEGLSPAVVGTP
jgi:hypothetical protein